MSRSAQAQRLLLDDGWFVRPTTSPFRAFEPVPERNWRPVTLPHDAVIASPRRANAPSGESTGFWTGGAFEYRRTLPSANDLAADLVLLELDGVYRDAAVFVNNALAGTQALGYSRFVVRLDHLLHSDEENDLRVTCRQQSDNRWYTGAGIYRDVHLITKRAVHLAVDGARVTTPRVTPDEAVVEVVAEVQNLGGRSRTVRVDVALLDADGQQVAQATSPVTVRPGDGLPARLRLRVTAPSLWSDVSPYLYQADVVLRDGADVLDVMTIPVGIRSIRVDPSAGLLVNEQVVLLRGACVHADNGPLGAAAIVRAEERKVERLKAAGFNAVRAAHHPMSSAFLEACDRLGVYVVDEAFDVWTRSKSDFDDAQTFPLWWERDLAAMVAKDVNHPSVIMYSIGNEIFETGSPDGGRWSRLLAERLRSLDPTRLITNGVNVLASMLDVAVRMAERASGSVRLGGVNDLLASAPGVVAEINDSGLSDQRTEESFAVLDVAGMNYAEAGYAQVGERWPGRVVLGTESHPREIDRIWQLVRELPYVIGDFTWTGWDYLGEVGIGVPLYVRPGEEPPSFHLPYPARSAGCADLDLLGNLRTQGAYRQTVFGLRSAPVIAVHRPAPEGMTAVPAAAWRWSDTLESWDWPGQEGERLQVEVYADADEVELLLDQMPVARSRTGERKAFLADLEVTYAPGTLTAVACRDGVETGRSSLVTPRATVALKAVADRTSLHAGPRDLAFVDLLLTDGQGVLRTSQDREVEVVVSGAGTLQALGSAAPVTEEGFTASSCRTHDGRALAVVRPTGAGSITVTVRASGCADAVVELEAG